MTTGTLIVSRIRGEEDKYVMCLMNMEKGQILETSRALTEHEVPDVLREHFGETDAQIEFRIRSAQANPAV